MKTFSANAETIKQAWFVVDAKDRILGRIATEIARRLRGKHKPEYTPHCDTGDYIVIINAECVKVTGNKANDKMYYRHSGYPGGLREDTFKEVINGVRPERALEHAIKGMLPKNSLGRDMFRKLKVYVGGEHPHAAQQPQVLEI